MSAYFPHPTPEYLLSFQFSSWYPTFSRLSIKSTVIRPLSPAFREYLDSDGVYIPKGSEDVPRDDDDESEEGPSFAFPELDAQIRACVEDYGAVFPKLNFSSPRDAAWILPSASPLKCTSPSDVYVLLKSSDFITHDLSADAVFAGCDAPPPDYPLELVLRKWYPIDRSRELRCFVRQGVFLGISQRDPNYYEFWNDAALRTAVRSALIRFWETHILPKWASNHDYTFDVLLTRDLSRAHIVDFNAYAPHTDPLLFTYEELHALLASPDLPVLRTIDSRAHPAAARNAPVHQHNMVPLEALTQAIEHVSF